MIRFRHWDGKTTQSSIFARIVLGTINGKQQKKISTKSMDLERIDRLFLIISFVCFRNKQTQYQVFQNLHLKMFIFKEGPI